LGRTLTEREAGLELWNEDATDRVKTVAPLFNRMAIFYVACKSSHGHPNPIGCPPPFTTAQFFGISLLFHWKKSFGIELQQFRTVERRHRARQERADSLPEGRRAVRFADIGGQGVGAVRSRDQLARQRKTTMSGR
jgi:hypothetical protein